MKVTETVYSCITCVKMADVKGMAVCSFNVNGISNGQKRKDILDYLCQHNHGIYSLQETHIKVESENFLRAAWSFNVWVAGSESNRNGIAILLTVILSTKFIVWSEILTDGLLLWILK